MAAMELQNGPSLGAAGMTLRVACGSLNAAICRSAYGAEQKLMIGTRGFRFCPLAAVEKARSDTTPDTPFRTLLMNDLFRYGMELVVR